MPSQEVGLQGNVLRDIRALIEQSWCDPFQLVDTAHRRGQDTTRHDFHFHVEAYGHALHPYRPARLMIILSANMVTSGRKSKPTFA